MDVWPQGFLIAEKLAHENSLVSYTIQSEPTVLDDWRENNRFSSMVSDINTYTYDGYSVLSPSNEDLSPTLGEIVWIGDKQNEISGISCGSIDVCNYIGGAVGWEYLSGITMNCLYTELENIVWSEFNFPNKEASSYIPTTLADMIIAFDENDSFQTYDDLIGLAFGYRFVEKTLAFSINNIYDAETLYGPAVTTTFVNPIITDSKTIFDKHPVSLYAGTNRDAIVYRELVYQLGIVAGWGYDFTSYFVDTNSRRLPSNDDTAHIIKNLTNNGPAFFNGTNALWFSFLVVCLLASLLLLAFSGFKNYWVPFSNMHFLWAFSLSVLFMLASGVGFAALGWGLAAYKAINPAYGIVGVFLPYIGMGMFFLGAKIGRRRVMTNEKLV